MTANIDSLPPLLRGLPQWVLWKAERLGDRLTKVPYSAKTGGKASSTDPATWTTFEEAVAVHQRGGYAGLGFVFAANGVVGVDLDHCLRPGGNGSGPVLHPAAEEIIKKLDSYTEVSPSGDGLHVLLLGKKPTSACSKPAVFWGGECALYEKSRFFVMTGNRFGNLPAEPQARQTELEWLCGRLWPAAGNTKTIAELKAEGMSIRQIATHLGIGKSGVARALSATGPVGQHEDVPAGQSANPADLPAGHPEGQRELPAGQPEGHPAGQASFPEGQQQLAGVPPGSPKCPSGKIGGVPPENARCPAGSSPSVPPEVGECPTGSHQPPESRVSAGPIADDELLELIQHSKAAPKFAELWSGNWNGPLSQSMSHSEADFKLCCQLAFYTKVPAQIDRLFRRSGLMRDKWDESRPEDGSYGARTIHRALERVTAQYSGKGLARLRARNANAVLTPESDEAQQLLERGRALVVELLAAPEVTKLAAAISSFLWRLPDIYLDEMGARLTETMGGAFKISSFRRAIRQARRQHQRPTESVSSPSQGRKPNIRLDTEEYRAIAETIQALTADPNIYQRGGLLVRILRGADQHDGIRRDGTATIGALPQANLRERMTNCATFSILTKQDGEILELPAHPAPWLVSAVDARADWPGIRHLLGVSDAPVLRADGSVWQTPGYDGHTGVLYEPSGQFPPVPDAPTIDDARRALASLLEVTCDFSFENEDHRAAWLAGLLTPLARFAFSGPSPLFLIDANVRAAGKGLLAQTIGWIVLGREMPVSSYTHEPEEMRKKITAIAIAGDRLVLLDNLEGRFGNDALDRALTSTRWKDRVLGKSEMVDLPLLPAWYATGNNVAVATDTARRIIHVRLDVLDEHPEDRTGFQHPNLIAWIREYRGRLLSDAMTILAAYFRAGQPSQNLSPFGSFEGWSNAVRQAVVWVGMSDPCLTRTRLAEMADTTSDALAQLISAWQAYDIQGHGWVISELLEQLYGSDLQPENRERMAMRTALENLVGCAPGKVPTPRQVAGKLRSYRRRVIGGRYLDLDPHSGRREGRTWLLFPVEESRA